MSFLQGYTAAAAGIAALEATRARSLLAAQGDLMARQHAAAQRLDALRQEVFAFAHALRQAREGGRYRQSPAHGVFEAQRWTNWMLLNDVGAAAFPSFEDKAFLLATCEEADRVTREGVAALGSRRAGAVQRLAVLEDLAPYAAEYQAWRTVRAALRRWTPLLFHGLPSLLAYVPLTCGAIFFSLVATAWSTAPGLGAPAHALGALASLAATLCALLALLGPFLRRGIVAWLRRRVGVHGGWINSRITAGEATRVLAGIRAAMARLDPALAARRPGEVLEPERLAALRAEPARLQAVVAGGG